MQNGYQLESGSGKAKYIVLGVIALVFAAGAYALIGKDSPPPKPHVAAAPAPIPSGSAPVTETSAAMPAGSMPTSAGAVAATPAVDNDTLAASSPAMENDPDVAMAEPDMSLADDTDSNDQPDTLDDIAPAGDEDEARVHQNRPAVRKPPPPAVDTLSAWWRSTSSNGFAVQFVGQAASQPALVVRFSQSVGHPHQASQHIELFAENGTPVAGGWQTGANGFVLLRNNLAPGRYTLKIDSTLASASGKALPRSLSGPVYIE